jgi:drug/metabolite transporter (DMT)-like permease
VSNVILAFYVIAASLAVVTVKLASKSGLPIDYIDGKLSFNLNLYSIIGVVLYGLSFIAYVYLISKNDLGYIIPLAAAFVYVFIFVASDFIFKEDFTITKVIGILLIIIGIVFLSIKK